MRRDFHWFFHLCSEQGLLDAERIHGALRGLSGAETLESLAARLAEGDWLPPDSAKSLVKEAEKRTRKGETPPALPVPEGADPTRCSPDFGSWKDLDDRALAAAMRSWIADCQSAGASDLHITAGARPRIRHHRSIVYLSDEPLEADLAERMNFCLLTGKQRDRFTADWDLDYALHLDEAGDGTQLRLRVNLIRQKNGVSGVYHMARPEISTLEELGFPNAANIRDLLAYHNGIILVTGPVGSGKTTTLASLVHELNENRRCHIVAIEDPIEVVQPSLNSIVTQREVGHHTASFDRALKSALREDPDVIVVGEMRDLETIEMAITAAETGHLVIGTLHTRDAATTLSRILDVFPSRQQSQIRAMTADSLRGILCQRLLPATDGGTVLACELMVNNRATANIMREGKEGGIDAAMQTGRKQGMRTMDESIIELYRIGRISRETAEGFLKDPNLIEEYD